MPINADLIPIKILELIGNMDQLTFVWKLREVDFGVHPSNFPKNLHVLPNSVGVLSQRYEISVESLCHNVSSEVSHHGQKREKKM